MRQERPRRYPRQISSRRDLPCRRSEKTDGDAGVLDRPSDSFQRPFVDRATLEALAGTKLYDPVQFALTVRRKLEFYRSPESRLKPVSQITEKLIAVVHDQDNADVRHVVEVVENGPVAISKTIGLVDDYDEWFVDVAANLPHKAGFILGVEQVRTDRKTIGDLLKDGTLVNGRETGYIPTSECPAWATVQLFEQKSGRRSFPPPCWPGENCVVSPLPIGDWHEHPLERLFFTLLTDNLRNIVLAKNSRLVDHTGT